MAAESFDFIVIGGGSGGSASARRAAGYGAKVCLIDMGPLRDASGKRVAAGFGGTCVNVGCVPKKIMFFASQQRESMVGHVATAKGFGYDVPESAGVVDWPGLKKRRDAYVKRLNDSYEANWGKAGIAIKVGAASFVDATTVKLMPNDGSPPQLLKAPKILIASGGTPFIPRSIEGGEHAITSDGFFDLEQLPKKVAVIGSGYIGVEMSGILHGLGAESHLFIRGDTVLRNGFDPFLVDTLMDQMRKSGPILHPNSSPIRITKNAKKSGAALGPLSVTALVKSTTSQEEEVTFDGFDVVLFATGRTPATAGLNLAAAGVETNKRGFVVVDEFENTTAKNKVFAVGDATTTGWELTPVAIAAGRRLADRLFGGEPNARIAYETIATVVFSHPPIGSIGLSEPKAIQEFGKDNVHVKQSRFPSMLYAFNDPDSKVSTGLKLVLAGPEEKVVGLHIIGPFSDEMLQGFAVAIRMGCTRADLEASVAIHPTISEELVTFGGWGQAAGSSKPLLPPYLQEQGRAPGAAPPAHSAAAASETASSGGPGVGALALAFTCGAVAAAGAAVVAMRAAHK